jgi:CheY-like chemotaxis protein
MPKILIVDDEELQRKALRVALSQKGYTTLEAMDGIEGLATAFHEHPDLILLDVKMPRMDGITMMHNLRKDEWGKKEPIIILTNYDTTETQLNQITTDLPVFYLIKSNTPLEHIIEKIEEALQSKKEQEKPIL